MRLLFFCVVRDCFCCSCVRVCLLLCVLFGCFSLRDVFRACFHAVVGCLFICFVCDYGVVVVCVFVVLCFGCFSERVLCCVCLCSCKTQLRLLGVFFLGGGLVIFGCCCVCVCLLLYVSLGCLLCVLHFVFL